MLKATPVSAATPNTSSEASPQDVVMGEDNQDLAAGNLGLHGRGVPDHITQDATVEANLYVRN